MVLIDVRPVGAGVVQTVRAMIEQIDARKATDPVANYDVLVNDAGDEILLDFLMSARDASGLIVEWNAYRYFPGPGGQGTTVIAISRRGYDDAARDFLVGLKTRRQQDISTLSALQPFDIRLQDH
jgi:NAD(P)-dependent dehydrogenase (short-subunit alcohol dehydrogenase family)